MIRLEITRYSSTVADGLSTLKVYNSILAKVDDNGEIEITRIKSQTAKYKVHNFLRSLKNKPSEQLFNL